MNSRAVLLPMICIRRNGITGIFQKRERGRTNRETGDGGGRQKLTVGENVAKNVLHLIFCTFSTVFGFLSEGE